MARKPRPDDAYPEELRLRLAAVDFPKRPRLHVGGWDYTERGGRFYGGSNNLPARMARMREFFPFGTCKRNDDGSVSPLPGSESGLDARSAVAVHRIAEEG